MLWQYVGSIIFLLLFSITTLGQEIRKVDKNFEVWYNGGLVGKGLWREGMCEGKLPDFIDYWFSKDNIIETNNSNYSEILPLIKTEWNQGHPYNNLCPEINSVKCLVGCVAVAVGQLMNYYRWPEYYNGGWTEYRVDGKYVEEYIEPHKINWPGDSIWLLSVVGKELENNYNLSTTGASSSSITKILEDKFGYKNGGNYKDRGYYKLNEISGIYDWKEINNEEWNLLVWEELNNKRPVLITGYSDSCGHEFLCDGYSSNLNMFHINWGWGGKYNGYYKLELLRDFKIAYIIVSTEPITGIKNIKYEIPITKTRKLVIINHKKYLTK